MQANREETKTHGLTEIAEWEHVRGAHIRAVDEERAKRGGKWESSTSQGSVAGFYPFESPTSRVEKKGQSGNFS